MRRVSREPGRARRVALVFPGRSRILPRWTVVLAALVLGGGVLVVSASTIAWAATRHAPITASPGRHLVGHRPLERRRHPPPSHRRRPRRAPVAKPYRCDPRPPPSAVQGTVLAPSLGLEAPVLAGTADSELNVAIGHDPYSVWPGGVGTSVLLAHDVSYFVHIDDLRVGQLVSYDTSCFDYTFAVRSRSIVAAGSPIYNTATPSLALVTCWPTNALYYTNNRLVVMLSQVHRIAVRSAPVPEKGPPPFQPQPLVPAPAALAAQGLALALNPVPMGTMTIGGKPSPAWVESPGPLNVQLSAIEAYVGGYKALAENEIGWWHDIAPRVRVPDALIGPVGISYISSVDVTSEANGTLATGATLSAAIDVSGGAAPGAYDLVVVTSVTKGRLVITSWSMRPA